MKKFRFLLFFGVFTASAETLEFELSDEGSISFNTTLNRVVLSDDEDHTDECSASVYPPNLSINEAVYSDNNSGFGFGETTNEAFRANFGIYEFLSLSEFGTDKVNFRRRLTFFPAPTNYNRMNLATISVSHCKGDFSETAVCKYVVFEYENILFSTHVDDDPNQYCILNPTRDYYFNIVLSADPYNESPSCFRAPDTSCLVMTSESFIE